MTDAFKFLGNRLDLVVAIAITSALGIFSGYCVGKNCEGPMEEIAEDYEVSDVESGTPCKMVLVVRKDLPMTKGKIAAQCAHAALGCYEKAVEKTPANVISWKSQGQAKIALQCENLEELQRLQVRAARLGVISEKIVDAGRTQIDPGSVTVLGIGPAPIKLVNEITGHLKLL